MSHIIEFKHSSLFDSRVISGESADVERWMKRILTKNGFWSVRATPTCHNEMKPSPSVTPSLFPCGLKLTEVTFARVPGRRNAQTAELWPHSHSWTAPSWPPERSKKNNHSTHVMKTRTTNAFVNPVQFAHVLVETHGGTYRCTQIDSQWRLVCYYRVTVNDTCVVTTLSVTHIDLPRDVMPDAVLNLPCASWAEI